MMKNKMNLIVVGFVFAASLCAIELNQQVVINPLVQGLSLEDKIQLLDEMININNGLLFEAIVDDIDVHNHNEQAKNRLVQILEDLQLLDAINPENDFYNWAIMCIDGYILGW